MAKVGLLLVATNKYKQFLQPLITSADEFFLKDHEVTYYVFTNNDISDIKSDRKIEKIQIDHMPFPFISLFRYKLFYKFRAHLIEEDYIYYSDVDMLFVDKVGDEILGVLVGTQHPGFTGLKGSPETRKHSNAYINENDIINYYAGGFNGGSTYSFVVMAEQIEKWIDDDLNNGIIAVWHDESHLNRYMNLKREPDIILSPSYCHSKKVLDRRGLHFEPKLIALDKNHEEVRS